MKLRRSLFLPSCLVSSKIPMLMSLAFGLVAGPASGATLYWDGGTTSIAGNGNGASDGGVGTWDLTLLNWDAGTSPHVAWTAGNDAVFGGTAGAVTLGAAVSANSLTFSSGSYNITTAAGLGLTVATGITNSSGLNSITGAGGLTITGPQALNIAGGFTISTPLTGSETLTKTGTGMLGLSGANTAFTGKIVVSAGRFGVNGDGPLGAVPAAPVADSVTVDGGIFVTGTPNNSNGTGFNNGGNIVLHENRGFVLGTNGGTFQAGYGNDGRIMIQGTVSGPGKLTKTDGGIVSLTGSNTFTGGIAVVNGALCAGQFSTGGAAVDGTNTSFGTGDIDVSTGAQLIFAGNNMNIPNNITLHGLTNSLNGRAGALIGGLQDGGSASTLSGTLTLAGTGAHNVSTWWSDKSLNLAGKVTGPGGLQINNIAGTANNNEGGIIILSNQTNDYVGNTTIANNGVSTSGTLPTLRLGAADVIPDGAGKGNVLVDGVLSLNGFTDTINGLDGAGTVSTTNTKLTVGNNNTSGLFTGRVAGLVGGGLIKIGTGTLTFSGTRDNDGARVQMDGGTLILGKTSSTSVHALGSNGNLDYALVLNAGTVQLSGSGDDQFYLNSSILLNGGTFDMNGLNEGLDGIFGAGGVITNQNALPSTLTIGQNNSNGSPVFSGAIQNGLGTIGLTKSGGGSQTLAGVNTYTGPTNIVAGTLKVDGSLAAGSVVTVGEGASLQGSGTIAGPVTTVGATSVIAPGGIGFGTLNTGATVIAGYLDIEVGAASSDLLNVSGNLDVTGATVSFYPIDTPVLSKYVIAKYTGTLTGTLNPEFLPDGYTLTHDTNAKEIYISGTGGGGEGFASFMAGFPSLTGADALPGADPDGDGVSNLLEYALNGFDPTLPNAGPGALAGGTVSFSKRPLAVSSGDLTYIIEESSTLGVAPSPWTAVTPLANDSSVISYTLPTGQGKVFVRLRVVKN